MTSKGRITAISLVILMLSSTGLLVSGIFTYLNYHNPYSYVPTPPTELIETSISPKANHTLIFVLDGVRADVFYEVQKTSIDFYDGWANFTDVECSTLLSVSRAGYGVISSGVNTSESQVISNDHSLPFGADSIWNTTIRHGGTTAFVGSQTWYELFGEWMTTSISFTDTHDGEATTAVNITSGETPTEYDFVEYNDSLVSDYSIQIVNRDAPTFMLVHFSETDEIGHDLGPLSETYRNAIERQDTYIGEILAAYDALGILNSTLVVVTSDHGQEAFPGKGGEHGGVEPAALHTPLLLRGPSIETGVYPDSHHQNSIAPTASAVMGWELPYDSSGKVLFECLDFDTRDEAVYRINEAALRFAQAETRVRVMGYSDRFESQLIASRASLTEAETSFAINDYEHAINDALLSKTRSNSILSTSWTTKVSDEIITRSDIFIIGISALCIIVAFSKGAKSKLSSFREGLSSLVTPVFVALLYLVTLPMAANLVGWQYSASFVAAYVYELIFLLITITLFPFLIAITSLLGISKVTTRDKNHQSVSTSLRFFTIISVVAYLVVISIFICLNGLGLPWYATDVGVPLMYFLVLMSVFFFTLYDAVTIVLIRRKQ